MVFGIAFYAFREVFKRKSGGPRLPLMERARRLLPAVESAALLVAIMFMGSLVLWVGVPVAWLWVGSQVQGSSSMAAAIGAMMIGMLVTIAVLVTLLGWLNRKHVGAAGGARVRHTAPERDDGARTRDGRERRRGGGRVLRLVLRLQRLQSRYR